MTEGFAVLSAVEIVLTVAVFPMAVIALPFAIAFSMGRLRRRNSAAR